MCRTSSETLIAASFIRLPTIGARRVVQMHLRTNCMVIVCSEIEGYTQITAEPLQVNSVAVSMVNVQSNDSAPAQHIEEGLVIVFHVHG
jgi:hypothetical protein